MAPVLEEQVRRLANPVVGQLFIRLAEPASTRGTAMWMLSDQRSARSSNGPEPALSAPKGSAGRRSSAWYRLTMTLEQVHSCAWSQVEKSFRANYTAGTSPANPLAATLILARIIPQKPLPCKQKKAEPQEY
jgi:hypothetical protein